MNYISSGFPGSQHQWEIMRPGVTFSSVLVTHLVCLWTFDPQLEPLFSIYTAAASVEDYEQVLYIVYTSFAEVIMFFDFHRGCFCLHRGLQLISRSEGRRTYFRVILANNTKESRFGHRKFPRLLRGSGPGRLASDASALTTEQPLFSRKNNGGIVDFYHNRFSWVNRLILSIGIGEMGIIYWSSSLISAAHIIYWWVY